MKNFINQNIIKPLKRTLRYYIKFNVPRQKRIYRRVIRQVRTNGQCRMLFIASSLPMWRYDQLIPILLANKRFEILIAIIPFGGFTKSDQSKDITQLTKDFASKGFPYEVVYNYAEVKQEFKPDIIVYPQPYGTSYADELANFNSNRDCLILHTPYSVPLTKSEWYYKQPMNSIAWRLYLPTEIHREVSRELADNHGDNVVVVGEPKTDLFKLPTDKDPWKKTADGKERKRLIWAPHFSVVSYNMFDRPDFNWTYAIMREMAEKYADRLQIAFKPHPRLRAELYKHPDWGKERTDEFYAFWENSPTTQLETGDYLDLFKTSDAMIHNCGSFTAEYLFVNKPVGYATGNLDGIKADMNDFGKACQDAHYTLTSADDIMKFIEQIVLDGNDSMSEARTKAVEILTRASGDRSVAENIYNDLTKSLFG